ncbi:MAG: hypothetical protein ABL867_10050 [Rickettsiales bacterium]
MEKKNNNKIEIPEIELPGKLLLTEVVIPEKIKIANKTTEKSPFPHIEAGTNVSPISVATKTPSGANRKR